MKIFSPPESSAIKAEPKDVAGAKKLGKSNRRPKPTIDTIDKKEISETAIREKLASHVETSNTAKSQVLQKNSQALGSGYMNADALPVKLDAKVDVEAEGTEKEKSSLKESHLLLSDVKLNDPNDSNTQEKLKSVLKMGAFNFNPKEKDALEKILAGT